MDFKGAGLNEGLVSEICKLAEKYGINKIILFGSRARGDFKERSDIDLAVSGGNKSAFALDIDELTYTLLEYDIINLDGNVQSDLLKEIEKDGKILYEKI